MMISFPQACAQEIERIKAALAAGSDAFSPVIHDYLDAEDDLVDEIDELKVRV